MHIYFVTRYIDEYYTALDLETQTVARWRRLRRDWVMAALAAAK